MYDYPGYLFKPFKCCSNPFVALVSDVRDVDAKEKIADLESKIVELEKQNAGLKNKVILNLHAQNTSRPKYLTSHVFFYLFSSLWLPSNNFRLMGSVQLLMTMSNLEFKR